MKAFIIQFISGLDVSGIGLLPSSASWRPWLRSTFVSTPRDTAEQRTLALPKSYAQKHAKATCRRRRNANARHHRQQQPAQRARNALPQALPDLGLPPQRGVELAGRLKTHKKRLGKGFGLMFPTLFGCTSAYEVARGRGWDQNLPSRLLGAWPKRSWLKRLRKLGPDILCPLGRHAQSLSAAPPRRWHWSWVWDDAVLRKYGQDFALVGRWYRGQHQRVVSGSEGVLLIGVMGEGQLIGPVDFAVRRPAPQGPGARCRDQRQWAQVMLAQSLVALARRGLRLPRPLAVADRGCSDSQWMRHVRARHQGVLLVHGKSTSAFPLEEGRKLKGSDLLKDGSGPWRQRLDAPGGRDARLQARSATYGAVTLIAVDKPGAARVYVMALATPIPATRLLRRWSRRTLIAQVFRPLTSLLATDAGQGRSADAYDGPLGLRLIASFVLHYTSRGLFKGRVAMDEMVCNLKHHWASVDCEALELYGLS